MKIRRSRFRVSLASLFFLLLQLPSARAESPAPCPDPRVSELRFAGSHAEALELARKSLESCRKDQSVPEWQIGDAEHLVDYLETVVSSKGEARQDLARADALQSEHKRATESWDLEKALTIAKEQYELRRKHLDRLDPELYASFINYVDAVRSTGMEENSHPMVREALELGRAIYASDHPRLAYNLELMAWVAFGESDAQAGRASARKSLEMRRRLFGENHTDVAASLHALALAEGEGSCLADCVRRHAEAVELRRRVLGPDHPDLATSLKYYAKGLENISEWGLAEQALREALSIRRRAFGDKHLEVADALSDLADILRMQQDLVEAGEMLAEGIEIQRGIIGRHAVLALSLERLAMLHRFAKEHEKAYPLFEETVAIREEAFGGEDLRTLIARANLAINHTYRGDHKTAGRMLAEVRGIADSFPEGPPRDWGLMVMDLYESKAAELEGDFARAASLAERCADRYREYKHYADLSGALARLAGLRAVTGEMEQTEPLLAEAASFYEIARRKTTPGPKSAMFVPTPYEPLALIRLEQGNVRDAWPAVEAARARVLADLLAGSGRKGAAQLGDVPFDLERVQAALETRTAIVGWLDTRLNSRFSRSWAYVIRSDGPVHWVRLQGEEDVDELAERLAAFGDALVETSRSTFGGVPASLLQNARALWAERFQKIEKHLEGVDELVIIPSWAMGSFPLSALIDGNGEFVGNRFRISYAPSASLLAWLRETGKPAPATGRTALLLGDPPFRPDHLTYTPVAPGSAAEGAEGPSTLRSVLRGDTKALERLPRLRWSREEVSHIAKEFKDPVVLMGKDASEASLVAFSKEGRLAKFDVIHLATHALVDGEKPERSGLVLSQINRSRGTGTRTGTTRDGIITGAEILADWSLDAELVTLSACETALGKSIHGEGVVGLSYPFLKAGARSLLLSLWNVDDRATALFMERFYSNWKPRKGKQAPTKAQALHEAQDWLRNYEDENGNRPYEHPYYWSAFVLLGDAR